MDLLAQDRFPLTRGSKPGHREVKNDLLAYKKRQDAGICRLAQKNKTDPQSHQYGNASILRIDGQFILVSQYIEGWKEIELDFHKLIKDLFIQAYSAAEWDKIL